MAKHYGALPADLDAEQVRDWVLTLIDRGLSPSSTNSTLSALRFLYVETLGCPDRMAGVRNRKLPSQLPRSMTEQEVARLEDQLAREKQKSAAHKETIRSLDEETIGLYRKLRRLRDQAEVVESLSAEVYRLEVSLGAAGIATERLKARLLRAMEAARSRSPSRADEELRKVLGRSRPQ